MRVIAPTHDVLDGAETSKIIWSERWAFRLCAKMVDVALPFLPDADGGGGTTISTSKARLSNVKLGS